MMNMLQMQAWVGILALSVVAGGSAIGWAQSPAESSTKASTKIEPADPKQAKLIADTRKMLALSRELQTEMAKNGPGTLSLEMVKKVEELQKLAAVVKAEMGKAH